MRFPTTLGVCLGLLLTTQVLAQQVFAQQVLAQQVLAQTSSRPNAGVRDPYITSTGETVDKPGQSQSAGTTKLDRKIRRRNNRIDRSICKGC